MSGGQGSSPGGSGYGDGQEMNIIYMACGVVALLLFLGWLFYEDVVRIVFFIKLHELILISYVDHRTSIQEVINWGQHIPYHSVTLENMADLSKIVGHYLVYPFMVIGLIFAAILWLRHPESGFKERETMDTLSEKMKETFPAIHITQGIGLTKEPIENGPWAMGLTPIEFAQKHKLLFHDDEGKVKVDRIRAKSLFSAQLGPLWKGIDKLKPHQRAIFAVLATYINYQRPVADKMMEQMARSATMATVQSGKLDYDGIDALIAQYGNTPKVKAITEGHAYVFTVFSEMLAKARETGIVANSLYLWIKPIDRAMWYTMNNVGRQAVYVETGAVRAHWLAEKELGYAIKSPMIDTTLDGLDEAIAQRIIRSLT